MWTPSGNLPPYWNPAHDRSVVAGNSVSFSVSAVDPEMDDLDYVALVLPPGASFDAGSRTFAWDTDPGAEGMFTAVFEVSDPGHAPVRDEIHITVKPNPGFAPPCAGEVFSVDGASSIGSSDLGMADRDTVWYTVEGHVSRLFVELSWTGAPLVDLDYYLHDVNGTVIQSGASLGQPELILVDDLDPGLYYFEVVGFTVPLETAWTLSADACQTLSVPATLTHFAASPEPGRVRLEWALPAWDEVAGFHVYRSGTAEARYERLTMDLLQGDGVYQYEDTAVPEGWRDAEYRLGLVTREGEEVPFGPFRVDVRAVTPRFTLAQNAPNPFSAGTGTHIRFQMKESSDARLQVFDLRGALVRTLVDGRLEAGVHERVWDGHTGAGLPAASGVYFYRLDVPGRHTETRRMVLTN
jgi:hypothetical protein